MRAAVCTKKDKKTYLTGLPTSGKNISSGPRAAALWTIVPFLSRGGRRSTGSLEEDPFICVIARSASVGSSKGRSQATQAGPSFVLPKSVMFGRTGSCFDNPTLKQSFSLSLKRRRVASAMWSFVGWSFAAASSNLSQKDRNKRARFFSSCWSHKSDVSGGST